jgi:iron complex outermembrane recepter protein
MSRHRHAVLSSATAALMLTAAVQSPPALAAEPSALIEEVIVTARKRSEPLQDVPASAAALSASFIEDVGGVAHLRDITDLIAGISINETQDANLAEPTIRGAGQARNRASVSATGLYRNGAYFATNSLGGKNFARMDTYDLERVEVLRGPQGALYGRNALGGSMNLISKRPTNEFEFDAGVAAGEKDLQRYEGKLNVPLGDRWAARLSQVYEKRDEGFYTDIDGNDLDQEKFEHTRVSVRFQPNSAVDINYVFDIEDETYAPGIWGSSVRQPDIDDAFSTTINTEHMNRNEIDNHNLVIDWALPDGMLTAVSNYRDRAVTQNLDNDYYLPVAALATLRRTFLQDVDSDAFFQELRYVADGTANVKWLIGADYFTHDTTEVWDQWQGDLFANAQTRDAENSLDSWAVFGSVEYAFSNVPVTLTGELRYAEDEIDGEVLAFRNANRLVPLTDFSSKDKFTNLPWSATAAYRFDGQDLLAYAKVASSYRHGGLNQAAGNPLDRYEAVLTYGEETSLTYEVGIKSSWFERALTANLAVYFTGYEDFLNTADNGCPNQCQLVGPGGVGLGFNPDGSRVGVGANGLPIPPNQELLTAFFIDNVGEAEAWGFEIDTTYRRQFETGGSLLLNLGYARGKGEVKSLNDDVSSATRALTDGAKLPFLRPDQIKGSVVFRQPLTALGGMSGFSGAALVASATYNYEDGGYNALSTVAPVPQGTVKRLNADLGLETTSWSLFVRGNNLTDHSDKTWEFPPFYTRNIPRHVYAEFMYFLR